MFYQLLISSGTYEVAEAEGVSRGTKVIVYLKDTEKRFSIKSTVEGFFFIKTTFFWKFCKPLKSLNQ